MPAGAPAGTDAPGGTGSRPGESVRRSARSGALGLAGAAVSGLFGFLLTVVVTRGFGTTGAGAFFALVGVVTVAGALCCLGADTGLIWALPRWRERGVRILTVALVPPLLASALLAAALAAAAGALAPRLLPDAGGSGVVLLRWVAAALPVAVLMTLLLAAVRAARPITHYVAVQFLLLPVSRPVLVGAVALAGAGLVAAAIGWLLPVALAALVCAAMLVPALRRPGDTGGGPDGTDWRRFWGFAAARAASAAIDAASMWVGVLLTAALAGQSEAGVFGAVGRYVLAGQLAMQGLRVAVAPQLSALLGAGRRADAAAVHRQTTTWVIVLSWPVYLLLAFFAPGFLRLFGSGFTAGAGALTVLAVAMLVNVGLGNVQTLLLMSGASRIHLAAAAAGLAVTVGGGVALIPRYGALGAALAWSGGIVVENVSAALAARRVVGEPLLSAALVRTALGVGAAVCAVGTAVSVPAGRGVPSLLVAVGLLALGAGGALAVPGVRRRLGRIVATLRPAGARPTSVSSNGEGR
ncbi:lipopolysaccharide biosynthesis protein [Actinocatenispora thailandica]|uniref:lipopolysaccharide biosynthesis protein n=1 Tax=Actinocatenispora thailandica TaxID=227318 RepID=UPI00194DD140|nr:lipopolysaccharide biosynthesis protein [Actinocatenispora thailandica]